MAKRRNQNKLRAEGQVLYDLFGCQLGEEAETEVSHALAWMRGDGEIQDFYQAEQNSRQDAQGIDFVVFFTELWRPLPLQVKRSYNGVRHHRKKYPHIPVVIVQRGDIMGQIRHILQKSLAKLSKPRIYQFDKKYEAIS